MRLFALSIRPLWHGLCVPTNIMAQGRTAVRMHSSPSAASWSFPIRSRHNNRLPRPHRSPQDPWPQGQVSLNFAHLATSAENWNGGREATSGLNDFAARKDCVRTRTRREPIAHLTKASSRHCLVAHSPHQKIRDSGIRKQENLQRSNYAGWPERLLLKRMYRKIVYDRPVADVLKSEGFSKPG